MSDLQPFPNVNTTFECWEECCFDCCVKRGWQEDILKYKVPFMCVHRTDLKGNQKVCAGDRKKAKKFHFPKT